MTQKVDKISVWLHDKYPWSTDTTQLTHTNPSQDNSVTSYMLFSIKILLECGLWLANNYDWNMIIGT
jgi:hypothetical protein